MRTMRFTTLRFKNVRGKTMVIAAACVALLLTSSVIIPTAGAQAAMCLGQPVTVDLALGQVPTMGNDVIAGTAGDDVIAAQDGDDLICGLGGNDKIWGQNGNDSIDGGDGDDRLRGGANDDTLLGGPGSDDLAGGPGNDVVDGQDGDDSLLRGGGGDDDVLGGPGDDALVSGNGGRDTVNGGPGADKVTGGPRPDVLHGEGGDDELRGHKGADEMWGGAGNDALFGGPQPDRLDGGSGADICNGGTTGFEALERDEASNCESHLWVETVASGASTRSARLTPVDSCEEYLEHMRSVAGERVGPYGVEGVLGEPLFDVLPVLTDAGIPGGPVALPAAPAFESDAATSVPFSETNNQVVGVDEPDIIKTDGARIIAVRNDQLRVFGVNGVNAIPTGEVTLDYSPRELLLDGDRVLLIGSRYVPYQGPGGPPGPIPLPGPVEELPGFPVDEVTMRTSLPYGETRTVITQIDISGSPTVLRTLELEGNYISAREIDGLVRLVVSSSPGALPFITPFEIEGDEAATEANADLIAESELDRWLGDYTLRAASGDTISEGPIVPCERIYRPDTFSGFGLLAVLTFDMQGDLTPGDGTAVITDAENVYASQGSLYVATTLWPVFNPGIEFDEQFEESYSTALHRFDITDPSTANYVASGMAEGNLLNQFSMHEYDDRLFVATTQGSPWGNRDNSESFITVLEVDGDTLNEVGKVGEMGRGERIYAVRYVGDTAYVVTFREIDPFYVVDLSDPTAPVVTGELKIPGYSSYLHPIGEDFVLGVGQEVRADGQGPPGSTSFAKASLFDVSDPSDPIERDVWSTPSAASSVEWDHRAFLYWPAEDLAVLPISQYSDSYWAGAVALRVTDEGLEEVARIDHGGGPIEVGADEPFFGPEFPQIERTLVIGDSLWSMSYQFLQSNNIQTFNRTGRTPF